jgi:hypothetical protein
MSSGSLKDDVGGVSKTASGTHSLIKNLIPQKYDVESIIGTQYYVTANQYSFFKLFLFIISCVSIIGILVYVIYLIIDIPQLCDKKSGNCDDCIEYHLKKDVKELKEEVGLHDWEINQNTVNIELLTNRIIELENGTGAVTDDIAVIVQFLEWLTANHN